MNRIPLRLIQRATGSAILFGALCGAIGGIAGSIAKIAGELVYNPRTLGQTPPPVILAQRLADHPLTHDEQQHRMQLIHFVFGVGTGAIYGAAAEVAPLVTVGYGTVFGIVLQGFTHESLVPAFGLDVPPWQQPAREHLSELFTHALYGLATEVVRPLLRRRFGPQPPPATVLP